MANARDQTHEKNFRAMHTPRRPITTFARHALR
jgi:hypothetical protein